MASALTAELTHLLEGSEETLEGLSEWRGTLGKPQQGVPSFDMAPVVTTDVYDKMLGKIGVLAGTGQQGHPCLPHCEAVAPPCQVVGRGDRPEGRPDARTRPASRHEARTEGGFARGHRRLASIG